MNHSLSFDGADDDVDIRILNFVLHPLLRQYSMNLIELSESFFGLYMNGWGKIKLTTEMMLQMAIESYEWENLFIH